jgi:hypothetical protein
MSSVKYTHISFSPSMLKDEIYRLCDEALEETVEEVKLWNFFEDAQPISIAGENCDNGYELTATDLKAWLYYYGSGTHMDKRNPYLKEYLNSEFYNKDRPSNHAIVRRGKDIKYTQPNYEQGHGTITRTGTDPKGDVISDGQEPKQDMTSLLDSLLNFFEYRLNQKLARLSFANCIVTSETNI